MITKKVSVTKHGLTDEERKEMFVSLRKAFGLVKRSGVDTKKAEDLMGELNRLNMEANQMTMF